MDFFEEFKILLQFCGKFSILDVVINAQNIFYAKEWN